MYYGRVRQGEKQLIAKPQCQDRQLYRVDTRNFGPVAVYDERSAGFVGLRRKFGIVLLDIEYHWDNGPPYGTALPWERLSDGLPGAVSLTCSFLTCAECGGPAERRPDEQGRQRCFHTVGSADHEIQPTHGANTDLSDWLKAMEKKYLGPPGWKPEWA